MYTKEDSRLILRRIDELGRGANRVHFGVNTLVGKATPRPLPEILGDLSRLIAELQRGTKKKLAFYGSLKKTVIALEQREQREELDVRYTLGRLAKALLAFAKSRPGRPATQPARGLQHARYLGDLHP